MEWPGVSIIVVCFNEEDNIGSCLETVLSMDYPENRLEVIVVDGNSSDGTRDIVSGFMGSFKNLKLVNNHKKTISSNRNIGIINAMYDYILFTDADCLVKKDWAKTLMKSFLEYRSTYPELAAAGGGNIAFQDGNLFTKGVGQAMDSYLSCVGSVQGKRYNKPRFVDSLACLNVVYDKKRVQECGLFDEVLGNMVEDYELNFRLRSRGYKLMYIPGANVYHKMRTTPSKFSKQMYAYGKGRGLLIRYKPKTLNLIYLLPLGFVFANLAIPLGLINMLFLLPILCYLLAVIVMSLFISIRQKDIKLFAICIETYLIIHYCYSLGETYGLLRFQNIMKLNAPRNNSMNQH